MKTNLVRAIALAALVLLAATAIQAATLPPYLNYQGVLRDANDMPLDGTYDMVFRFFGPSDVEIMIDEHLASGSGAVTVTGGMFNAQLGAGTTSDGSGPGTYGTLSEVFRDYGEVYLEVQVGADPGGERLIPRVRILSTSYAMNSDHLRGLRPNQLLRSDTSDVYTVGTMTYNAGTTLQIDGTLNMDGPVSKASSDKVTNFNADLLDDLDSSAFSRVGHTHPGSDITGPVAEATNADTLDGMDSGEFIDTSSATQTKLGTFEADAGAISDSYGVRAFGTSAGGYFQDSDSSSYADIAYGDWGVWAYGNGAGGFFKDRDDSGEATVGYGDRGIWATGNTVGGHFGDADSTGFANVGYGDQGIWATGGDAGGHFEDRDDSGYADVGAGDYGIQGFGDTAGGYFRDIADSGYAYVGIGNKGIWATGDEAGGHFEDHDNSGYADVGAGDYGIQGFGDTAGGYFKDTADSGYANLGWGDYGAAAYGNTAGGFFEDIDGGGYAYVGYDDYGVYGSGNGAGAYFRDNDNSGYAYVGYFDEGISAHGTVQGGYFQDDDDTGQAHLAYGDYGIQATGNHAGAYFWDSLDSGYAYLGYGHTGSVGYGNTRGGEFKDTNSDAWAWVGYSTYKIYGSGTVSFVQNHPEEKDRVIVYAAPEGDEVAVYTRGTARLIDGEARIRLGETFQWVANPDIGLTAYVTPRGQWSDLYVASVSTGELVVRSRDGQGEGSFDYVVYGLRIGFEEVAIVQEKKQEAYIPAMTDHRELFERQPELRKYDALERFEGMESQVRGTEAAEIDMSRAAALKAAIEEYDPEIHGPVVSPQREEGDSEEGPGEVTGRPEPPRPAGPPPAPGIGPERAGGAMAVTGQSEPEQSEEAAELTTWTFPVSEPVERGDLLVLDLDHPGKLRRADTAADPHLLGIAAADAVEIEGQLQVVMVDSLYAVVKVDAGYGAILAGDLLTCSPTAGHAMIALDPLPGSVIGKAAEPLPSGRGLIKVFVMPR